MEGPFATRDKVTTVKKKVKFEKWVDPLNANINEVEWPGFNVNANGETEPIYGVNMAKVIHTPFGALSVLSNTMASNQFDFWWMHTNFDITNQIKNIIKEVPGVETLEVYTRYRARVGFPRSGFFEGSQIMHNIQATITEIDHDKQNQLLIGLPMQVVHSVIDMRDKIDAKHDNWAMLVLPNGHIEVVVSDKADNTYTAKVKVLNSAKSLVGGRLITSEV